MGDSAKQFAVLAAGAVVGYYTGGLGYSLAGGYNATATAAAIGKALGTAVGMYAGSTVAASMVGLTPDLPDFSTSNDIRSQGILANTTNSVAPIPVIYGRRRVGGNHVFVRTSGEDNNRLHIVTVLGEGEIDSVEEVYLNSLPITDSTFAGVGGEPPMDKVETTKQVLNWRGEIRDYMYIKFSCVVAGAPTYFGSGDEATLEAGASAAGIVYDENFEGFGDKSVLDGQNDQKDATIELKPFDTSQLNVAKLHDAEIYVAKAPGGSKIQVVQYPNSSNGYQCVIRIINPNHFRFEQCGEQCGDPSVNNLYHIAVNFRQGTQESDGGSGGELAQSWAYLGSDSQSASGLLVDDVPEWTSNHRLRGTAYLYTRLTYDQDAFPGGIPLITATVKGRKIYDVRTGSTAWSDNPALCIRDYLTNTRYGRGIDSSLLDDASFIAAANYCDNTVSYGGVSQKRYTCNGVVDTSRTSLEIIRELLSSCKGYLLFSGGKYKLIIDKPETATFTFDEDNIVGAWSISLASKRNTFNRVRAHFTNPNREWQADIAITDSTALRDQDNGLVLEREIDLPYTTSKTAAVAMSYMAINQSRNQIYAEFNATIEGLRCEVGDVVYISHATPGWNTLNSGAGKKFRILELSLQNNDEVRVSAMEYDEDAYDYGEFAVTDSSPDTNLPNPLRVLPPTGVITQETLYFNDPVLSNRVRVSWNASNDRFVRKYEVEYQEVSSGVTLAYLWKFTPFAETTTSTAFIDNLKPGIYLFRVRAINSFGVRSQYAYSGAITVKGKNLFPKPKNPGISSVSESLYATTNGSGVKAKVTLNWSESTNNTEWENIGVGIDFYECEFLPGGYSRFISAGKTEGTTFDFLDLAPGRYIFRVRAVNQANVRSNWASTSLVVAGLTAKPADITGLYLQIANGQAIFNWEPHPDLDVKIGGTIRFRHSSKTTGAEWKDSIDIGRNISGASTNAILPLLPGTYMAKAVDSTGNESEDVQSVTTTVPSLLNLNFVVNNTQHPDFDGALTNMFVDDTASVPTLKLTSTVAWDSVPDTIDNWALIDAAGGLEPAGSYEFDDYTDLGYSQTWRVTPSMTFTVGDTGDVIDLRVAYLDDWKDFDDNGKDITDVQPKLFVAYTDDDPAGSPTWSSWERLVVGDYKARAFKFKLDVSITETSHQIYVTELNVEFDAPDKTEWERGISSGTSVKSISYNNRFYVTPALAITSQDMDTGDYYTISNESETGFDIQFFNSSATGISRTFNYFARGF